jgi:hypothetical protein
MQPVHRRRRRQVGGLPMVTLACAVAGEEATTSLVCALCGRALSLVLQVGLVTLTDRLHCAILVGRWAALRSPCSFRKSCSNVKTGPFPCHRRTRLSKVLSPQTAGIECSSSSAAFGKAASVARGVLFAAGPALARDPCALAQQQTPPGSQS